MKKYTLATTLLCGLFSLSAYAVQVTAVTASAYDSDKGHKPANIADGDVKTRWAANGESWVQLELDKEQSVENFVLVPFKADERKLKFSVSYSSDGKTWKKLADNLVTSSNAKDGEKFTFPAVKAKFFKLDTFGTDVNKWSAINEISFNSAAQVPAQAIK
ncbi:discoidin domain-containing protein [Pectobacterium aroidearum]|uniref:discoidin domain-containing protein n=1 Tax=Pectobacterium TaxID=122277 RepID=UPI0018893264|nr:discoidin domain-containing protein [Pectobacterium carotovorum]